MTADALLLDLDGTLLRTGDAIVHAGVAAMAAAWPDLDPRVYRDAAERYRHDSGGYFARYAAGGSTYDEMRRDRFARAAHEMGLPDDEGASRRHGEVFLREFRRLYTDPARLYPDALPMLDRFARAGARVGLLTNSSDELTRAKLGGLGLAERFDAVVTRDTLGFGKPDPRAFHHACKELGSAPEQTTYVGDELRTDALGARDAGLRGVWLSRPGVIDPAGPADPHGIRVIASLDEV